MQTALGRTWCAVAGDRPVCKTDSVYSLSLKHSSMSTPWRTEVKNEWSYTFTPPVCLNDLQKNNFTFTVCSH